MRDLETAVKFFTVMTPEGTRVKEIDLTDGERLLLQSIEGHGYLLDVFYAYMAQTYPRHSEAPNWRKLSGTRSGVNTAEFLGALGRGAVSGRLVWKIEAMFCQQHVNIDPTNIDVPAMALILWLKGETFQVTTDVLLTEAATHRPLLKPLVDLSRTSQPSIGIESRKLH